MKRLEKTIIKNLIYNEEYARKVIPFIRPEYFSDINERNVFKEVQDFASAADAILISLTRKSLFPTSKKTTRIKFCLQ